MVMSSLEDSLLQLLIQPALQVLGSKSNVRCGSGGSSGGCRCGLGLFGQRIDPGMWRRWHRGWFWDWQDHLCGGAYGPVATAAAALAATPAVTRGDLLLSTSSDGLAPTSSSASPPVG